MAETIRPDRLVIATGNRGKLQEFKNMLQDLSIEVCAMAEVGITQEIPENGTTLSENACEKALYVRNAMRSRGEDLSRTMVLADDTGLCVDALGGAPGIYTARYAGEGATDRMRWEKLLHELQGLHGSERSARFVCVLAVIMPGEEPACIRGIMEGQIAEAPKGENGFGYDPVFWLPEAGKTLAELTGEEKDAVSHRGKAMRLFKASLCG